MAFCVKAVLRWSVALLGLRIAISDIAALGLGSALVILVAMVATIVAGFACARLSGQPAAFGALIGVGTAVCGASATLAVSTVVPDYKNKKTDIVFIVVALNALATLAMLVYPPLCTLLHLGADETGILLGGAIHDVAQVAGAGYAISADVGNSAVVVKLFRVFLLLPVVVAVGLYFGSVAEDRREARVPIPGFAIAFVLLCVANSAAPSFPSILPIYTPVKATLVEASTYGLLLAISALGLGTSITQILRIGCARVFSLLVTTLIILLVVTCGLIAIRHG